MRHRHQEGRTTVLTLVEFGILLFNVLNEVFIIIEMTKCFIVMTQCLFFLYCSQLFIRNPYDRKCNVTARGTISLEMARTQVCGKAGRVRGLSPSPPSLAAGFTADEMLLF